MSIDLVFSETRSGTITLEVETLEEAETLLRSMSRSQIRDMAKGPWDEEIAVASGDESIPGSDDWLFTR